MALFLQSTLPGDISATRHVVKIASFFLKLLPPFRYTFLKRRSVCVRTMYLKMTGYDCQNENFSTFFLQSAIWQIGISVKPLRNVSKNVRVDEAFLVSILQT